LERLDKIDGVEASSANHTGTLIRISVKARADGEQVAAAVQKDLTASKGNPTRLVGEELRKTLQDEEWRDITRIGQLSAIEFRKLNLDRVKAFVEKEKLDKDVADKLLKLAETEWTGWQRRLKPRKEISRPTRPTGRAGASNSARRSSSRRRRYSPPISLTGSVRL
jgi:hypothetical protein